MLLMVLMVKAVEAVVQMVLLNPVVVEVMELLF